MVDIDAWPGLPNLGLIIGLLGTVVTVVYMIFSKSLFRLPAMKRLSISYFP